MSEALNVIKAHFGAQKEVTTAPVWQYDYGQILEIDGIPNLPSTFEIHYSNSKARGTAKRWIGYNGAAEVLDEYFVSGADIWCFIVLHEGANDGETEYIIHIPVKERSQSEDAQPTPVQRDIVTEAIAALNTAVAQCGAYVEHYPTVVDGYWYVWDEASEQFVSTGVPATGNGIASARLNSDYTLTLVFTDGTSFTTPISIRGEKGEPGEPGAKGDPGAKGEPGATGNGIASIAKTATVGLVDTYTITFTDGTTTTFDVTNGTAAIDDTLSIAGRAADAKAVGDKIADVKSDFSELKKSLPYTDKSQIAVANKEGTDIVISEKSPRKFSIPTGAGILKRNRFNIATAVFEYSGYSSANTITKENGGIKVVSSQTSTSSYTYCYTDYTAEITGNLYVSCVAKVDGNVQDLRMSANLNGESQEILYGEGLLYMIIPVTKGDTVRLKFYMHCGTPSGSTTYYSNIMLAYEGFYDYLPYDSGASYEDETKTINLADYISNGVNHSNGSSYNVTIAGLLSDLFELPASNNAVAQGVIVRGTGLTVDAYNNIYNGRSNGIGVNTSGNIVIYIVGMKKSEITTWLESNPVTITYVTSMTETPDLSDVQRGDIITFDNANTISYAYEPVKRKKVVCFGDSVTGLFANRADYPQMLYDIFNYDSYNIGFSGCDWTDHPSANRIPFCMNRLVDSIVAGDFTYQESSNVVDSESSQYNPQYRLHLDNLEAIDFSNIDYVTMFWGINDWNSHHILKSADDTATENKQRTNVEDAVKYCIDKLQEAYPNIRIIVICPMRTFPNTGDTNFYPNNNNDYLYDFSDYIEETAHKHANIPVINLYWDFGTNPYNYLYFTKDGTHPSERGKLIIAERINTVIDNY